jgi:preprotein translocase subunit SecE
MGNQRALALGTLALTAALAYVLMKAADLALVGTGVGDPEVFGGLTASVLIGVGIAVVAAVVAWNNARFQEVGGEVVGELGKVTWPTGAEIRAATIAVLVATALSAVILGFMDFLSAKVMTDWIPQGIRWAQGLFT